MEGADGRWLLLIHQIPPRPAYLRVKVGRRLHALGAVAIKNSVYVLPRSPEALEDFQWIRTEIVAGGGGAFVCEAHFLEGLADAALEGLFGAAREADYAALCRELRRLGQAFSGRRPPTPRARERVAAALPRLRRRFDEIARIDFFGTAGRMTARELISGLEAALQPARRRVEGDPGLAGERPRGRRWVTRADVRVDRIASAWLIRRFIDPEARFGFVTAERSARPGELRFDMFEAEFTHEADLCTFEVLLRRFGLEEAALRAIADVVHDLDVKDGRHGRPETPGLARLIAGLVARHRDDEARLRAGAEVLDALYESFRVP